ncbi:acyltransferase family protein [Vibrio sp. MA40-2]|uniref:acyltransferase family protein n=1 Tax=Vibrio sp. MA40-2 TaxID=3391828 RepID=UPI0039A77CCE
MKDDYKYYFENVRALGMFLIVLGHVLFLSDLKIDDIFEFLFLNIVFDGTVLFVFISGYFFCFSTLKNFNYKVFIRQKFYVIAIPYIVMSFLPTVYWIIKQPNIYDGFFLPSGNEWFDVFFVPFLKYLLTGKALTGYWFMPFILVVFLLSPLWRYYANCDVLYKILILIFFVLISIFSHRSIDNINNFQSFFYYLPVFFIGILYFQYEKLILSYLKLKLVFSVTLLFFLLFLFYQSIQHDLGSYHKEWFVYSDLDLMFIQKLFFIPVLLVVFQVLLNHEVKLLNIVATHSFSIYFLHPILIQVYKKLFGHVETWFAYILLGICIFISCIVISMCIRKVFGKYSQYLIGR